MRRKCSFYNSCKEYNINFSLKKHKVLVQTCNKLPLGYSRPKSENQEEYLKVLDTSYQTFNLQSHQASEEVQLIGKP